MNYESGTVKTDEFELDYFKFGAGEKTAVIIPGMSLKPVLNSAALVAERY